MKAGIWFLLPILFLLLLIFVYFKYVVYKKLCWNLSQYKLFILQIYALIFYSSSSIPSSSANSANTTTAHSPQSISEKTSHPLPISSFAESEISVLHNGRHTTESQETEALPCGKKILSRGLPVSSHQPTAPVRVPRRQREYTRTDERTLVYSRAVDDARSLPSETDDRRNYCDSPPPASCVHSSRVSLPDK